MSKVFYQSLVSCFESRVTETTILKMKMAPAPTTLDVGTDSCSARSDRSTNEDLEMGSTWNFLQNLSKIPTCPKKTMENENSYVHIKSSFPKLNGKISLDLCTENLGSETGTECITDSNSIFSLDTFSSQSETSSPMNQQQQMKSSRNNKMTTCCRSFPPPLTTMSGSSSLQMRAQREGGRLIIKAVEAHFSHSYMQTDRSHGRLRLSFFQDYGSNFDSDLMVTTEEETDADCQLDDEIKRDSNDGDDELENEEIVSEADDDYDVDDECDLKLEAMDAEIEMEKNQRLTRCNEGGHGTKGLCNWKPTFCVATS